MVTVEQTSKKETGLDVIVKSADGGSGWLAWCYSVETATLIADALNNVDYFEDLLVQHGIPYKKQYLPKQPEEI